MSGETSNGATTSRAAAPRATTAAALSPAQAAGISIAFWSKH